MSQVPKVGREWQKGHWCHSKTDPVSRSLPLTSCMNLRKINLVFLLCRIITKIRDMQIRCVPSAQHCAWHTVSLMDISESKRLSGHTLKASQAEADGDWGHAEDAACDPALMTSAQARRN